MVIPYGCFVNEDTVNIFTDASIKKINIGGEDTYIGSPGADAYYMGECVYSLRNIIPLCTNNESEIVAIRMGLNIAANLRPDMKINLFSDSKLSIYGVREWIYNWVRNEHDGIIYGTGGPLINQQHFLLAVYSILQMNRPVNLYHIRGHRNPSNYKDRKIFSESFRRENKISNILDEQLIDFFISANDYVDKTTGDLLSKYKLDPNTRIYHPQQQIFNYHYFIRSLDMAKFYKLTSGFNNI